MSLRIGLVGAGAIGGFLTAHLTGAGAAVHVLARGATLAAWRDRGLTLTDDSGTFTVRPAQVAGAASDIGPVDLILFTVKGQDSVAAADAMAVAKERYKSDKCAHHESPDRLYDRQWASELMNHVLDRLRNRYSRKGREKIFETLCPGLLNGGSLSGLNTEELARGIGSSPGALRTAFHRLLEDYREELRKEIMQTVENQELAKIEYDELIAIFSIK